LSQKWSNSKAHPKKLRDERERQRMDQPMNQKKDVVEDAVIGLRKAFVNLEKVANSYILGLLGNRFHVAILRGATADWVLSVILAMALLLCLLLALASLLLLPDFFHLMVALPLCMLRTLLVHPFQVHPIQLLLLRFLHNPFKTASLVVIG